MAQQVKNPTVSVKMWVWSLAPLSGLRIHCGVGHRRGSDLALLWLWYRRAAAPPTRPLAGDLPVCDYGRETRQLGQESRAVGRVGGGRGPEDTPGAGGEG